ncbi:MAG TPA: MBL fold metallo-hydrolase [Acetobacteraceae bacterium]|nr:MBL fold metallo-hydrolase [Acetobacteraceae bacterium]
MGADITAFFDTATSTASYLVADPATGAAAIIDPVLDFDQKSGRTGTAAADRIIAAVRARNLSVGWLLETHVHADHLTAALYLQDALGGRTGIGAGIREVQDYWRRVFNAEPGFTADGHQFDRLWEEGDKFEIGQLPVQVLHTPGHTAADVTYLLDGAAFVGDTLFMPDYGTARADFPGGDARALYRSIRRILALPPATRLFTAHDYKAPGRDHHAWESTVATQRATNVHVHDGISEDDFAAMRTARDATLPMPTLILPSVQVNMRAGHLPPPDTNGRHYLKLPLNAL